MSILWISWESHRRNRSICETLKIDLLEVDIKAPRIERYIKSAHRTIKKIREYKPSIIVAQNPSIALTALCVLLKPIFSFKLIIDAHNSGVRPKEGKSSILNRIVGWLNRKADKVIVTNDILAEYISNIGIKPFILPDPIPNIPNTKRSITSKGDIKVLFICSWADDEPYREVLEAARATDAKTHIYVTGNYQKTLNDNEIKQIPDNVTLCGFVSNSDFDSLLYEVDYVMDFTTRSDCLVCGAYEGAAAETPLILSNTKVTKDLFYTGAIYSELDIQSIAKTLDSLEDRLPKLKQEILQFKTDYQDNWLKKSKNLFS